MSISKCKTSTYALPSAVWNCQRIGIDDVIEQEISLVIDPGMLTPEQEAELLGRQDTLRAEAYTVLAELNLMKLLTSECQVGRLGSSALGLMVCRDIDMNVPTAGANNEHVLETMRPVECPFCAF